MGQTYSRSRGILWPIPGMLGCVSNLSVDPIPAHRLYLHCFDERVLAIHVGVNVGGMRLRQGQLEVAVLLRNHRWARK